MKRVFWLFLILLLFSGIAYYVSLHDDKNSPIKGDRAFAVDNVEQVHKIFMASRKGKPITLTRNGDHWLLDKTYRVQQRVISSTLDALKNLELSFIPPKNAYDDVMKEIAAKGLKVEVYDKRNKKIRSFYIGGTSFDGFATQMIVEGYDQPYMMRIRGFHGGLRPRFEKKYTDWRDRQIFRDLSEGLDTLRVVYPRHRNESFILTHHNAAYSLIPAFSTTEPSDKKLEQDVVKRYLYDVQKMVMEGFNNDNPKRDSLSQLLPFASVYIKTKDGKSNTWNFIPYRRRLKEKENAGQDLFYARNIERYYVFNSNRDLLLGQQQILNNIYWGYSSFY